MSRKFSFEIHEWYHCYNRGIDKRVVFDEEKDARRFVELLYLANDTAPVRRDEVSPKADIFSRKKEPIVAVVAYALMPNHYHLVLREIREGGISLFMLKLGTAYTMYYNAKNERVGNLFMKPFRAKHLKDDRYMQHAVRYVHMNPCELFEPNWKKGRVKDISILFEKLMKYEYSSLLDFEKIQRAQGKILEVESASFLAAQELENTLDEARAYYFETAQEDPQIP